MDPLAVESSSVVFWWPTGRQKASSRASTLLRSLTKRRANLASEMAPNPRAQKRKREPHGASPQDQPDASNARRRRAVPRSQPIRDNAQQESEPEARSRTRKRTRTEPNRHESGVDNDEDPPPRRKRGRPPRAVPKVETAPVIKKRGRPSRASLIHDGGGRTGAGPSSSTATKQMRGRPSLTEVPIRDAQNRQGLDSTQGEEAKRRRCRPPLSNQSQRVPKHKSASEDVGAQEEAQPAPRASRPSKPRLSMRAGHQEDGPAGDETNDRTSGPDFDLAYPYLKEKKQMVPRSRIDKWIPLDEGAIAVVQKILQDAQRPVLYHLRNGQRRQEHATSILSAVSNHIQRKLVKGSPFPPPIHTKRGRGFRLGHAEELDYERTVDMVQDLESRLKPTLHSIALLKAEVAKEEAALEEDYKNLQILEKNSRLEARTWKQRMRKGHVLAPDVKDSGQSSDAKDAGRAEWDNLELVLPERHAGEIFKDLDDAELVQLSQQIGSHMESLKGNLQQVDGVLPAMARSKAALQDVLLKHLDASQYDGILFG